MSAALALVVAILWPPSAGKKTLRDGAATPPSVASPPERTKNGLGLTGARTWA